MNTKNQPNGPKKIPFYLAPQKKFCDLQNCHIIYNLIECIKWTFLKIDVNTFDSLNKILWLDTIDMSFLRIQKDIYILYIIFSKFSVGHYSNCRHKTLHYDCNAINVMKTQNYPMQSFAY
jgi:hypothetical protein